MAFLPAVLYAILEPCSLVTSFKEFTSMSLVSHVIVSLVNQLLSVSVNFKMYFKY